MEDGMNKGEKASRIWFVLFWVSFVIMVISVAALLRQQIGKAEADARFEELQSEANAHMDENSVGRIYDAQKVDKAAAEKEEKAVKEEVRKASAETETQTDSKSRAVIEEALRENIVPLEETAKEAKQEAETTVPAPEKTLDWEALRSKNADIYAWIYVPDTGVDYPVVQHPTDNSYYLNHNLDGSKGYPGCIYTENFNRRDFTDIHTVLYGHNLKDKTMFSTLHNFEDQELFQKDHYIYLYTEDAVFVYRIFAAYEFSSIHLLDNFDYANAYVYEDYLRQIRQAAGNIRQDVEVTTKDRIITLSTCTADHDAARRFLVTGVLVN